MTFEVAVTAEVNPDWLSSRIMKKIDRDYSHCIIIEADAGLIWQSTGKGFHSVQRSKFFSDGERKIAYVMPINVADISFAKGWLRGKEGVEYSTSQYLGFIYPLFKPFVSNKKEKMICSEVQYRFAVECCGMPDDLNADFVDPGMAWDRICNYIMKGK